MTVRIVSIVGARPQFVKLAPMCRAVAEHNARAAGVRVEHVIVHTGQHYDPELSEVFFEELEIPRADVNLGIGSGPHGQQVGRMLEQFESVLLASRPDAVIVYGDTNSTIAGALRAACADERQLVIEPRVPRELPAPVAAGQPVGDLIVRHGDRELGRVALLSDAGVDEAGWLAWLWPSSRAAQAAH